ncbi:unnamed protein product, partial [Urochloa humidicola]
CLGGREPRCGARTPPPLPPPPPPPSHRAAAAGHKRRLPTSAPRGGAAPRRKGQRDATLPSARNSPGSVSMRSGCWAQARLSTSTHGEEEQRSAASSKGQSQYLTPEALTPARWICGADRGTGQERFQG